MYATDSGTPGTEKFEPLRRSTTLGKTLRFSGGLNWSTTHLLSFRTKRAADVRRVRRHVHTHQRVVRRLALPSAQLSLRGLLLVTRAPISGLVLCVGICETTTCRDETGLAQARSPETV